MLAASVYYLGITALLLAIFIYIGFRTYGKKERERGELPKYRMMDDDSPRQLSPTRIQEVPMSDDHNDFDGIRYREETKSPAIFRMLFTLLVVWAVAYAGYYLFSGWSSEAEFLQKQKIKREQIEAARKNAPVAATGSHAEGKSMDYIAVGKKEFADRCAACHGAEGKGGIGPDLTAATYKFGKNATAVQESIAEGRPGGMPGFKNDLSHEKMEAIVQFVLSLK